MYPLIDTIQIFEKLKNGKSEIKKEIIECACKNSYDTQIYLWKKYKNLKIENKYVDFLSIVRDGEFYYKNVFPKIYEDLEKNLNTRFFIYENNSTDNTKEILKTLSLKHNNIFIKSEDLEIKNKNRFEKITLARNNLSKFYKKCINKNEIGGNWLFLYDTDIIFNYEESIKPLMESNYDKKGLMFLTFSVFAGYNKKLNFLLFKQKKTRTDLLFIELMLSYYYDTLALEYGSFFSKNTAEFFQGEKKKKINTGFGGLGMISTIYYLTSYYDLIDIPKNIEKNKKLDDKCCEHWGFGKRLNTMGYMYIISDSNSLWYQDRDYLNDKFFDYVIFFIKNKKLSNIYYT